MSVCAVVVTYNRREWLERCLDAVMAQPVDSVVVIDNASTDGTEEWLGSRSGIRVVRLESNAGSAGGFAAGVTAALDEGADWIWLMDDDAKPQPDSLELLLAGAAPGDAALAPAVVRPDGSIDLGHRGRFRRKPRPLPESAYSAPGAEIDYFTFVGVLVRATAARAAGPPKAELFIWADDYEYSFRMRGQGALRLIPGARVVHHDVGQAYVNRRSRFWNRLTGWSFVPTPLEAFWRNLCGVRNYVWVKKTYEGQTALSACGTVAQFVLKALLYDEQPLRRIPWIVRYGRAGRRGDFTNIAPAEWAAMVRRSAAIRGR